MPTRTIYYIKKIETNITNNMAKRLGVLDITPSQYTVLSGVDDTWQDLSSAQLARRFFITPQSMFEIIRSLQRKELIEKIIDPKHKRIQRIHLTDKGRDLLDACNVEMNAFESETFSVLTEEELVAYRQLMKKILVK